MFSPLHEVVHLGLVNVLIKLLHSVQKSDLNLQDTNGCTPLLCAAQNEHLMIVRLLLEQKGIDFNLANI